MEAARPRIDLLARLVLGVPVALLQQALGLLAVAVGAGQVVVAQVALFLLHLTGDLLPVAFDTIPVHGLLHCTRGKARAHPMNAADKRGFRSKRALILRPSTRPILG